MKTAIDSMLTLISENAFALAPIGAGIFNSISGLWKFVDLPTKVGRMPYSVQRRMLSPKGDVKTLYVTNRHGSKMVVDEDDCILFVMM